MQHVGVGALLHTQQELTTVVDSSGHVGGLCGQIFNWNQHVKLQFQGYAEAFEGIAVMLDAGWIF